MPARQAFDWGALAGMLFMVGASAAHWLITPLSHPHASSIERWSVYVQLALGFGVGTWLYLTRRPPSDTGHGPAML